MIHRKTPPQLDCLRQAARDAERALRAAAERLLAGTEVEELERTAVEVFASHGAGAVFRPLIVVEGRRQQSGRLEPGNLVGIDVGCVRDGWFADVAGTWCVGKPDPSRQSLLSAADRILAEAIDGLKRCSRWSKVQEIVVTATMHSGFRMVGNVAGHGIGRSLHEDPLLSWEPVGPTERDFPIQAGLVLCLELAVTEGFGACSVSPVSGWPEWSEGGWLRTCDGHPCVHLEAMVAVTEAGVEVLASPPGQG